MRAPRLSRLAGLAALVLGVVALAAPAHAQRNRMGRIDARPGATAPVVQLFTFGRGDVIFEKFGHTAICLDYDEPERETTCFNYGVTDFTLPPATLTWRFIRGKQVFFVEPIPLSGMMRFYQHEDRTIWRQSIPLDEQQARAAEKVLLEDLDPKRGSYIYDHFVDNCTTRLRDIIDNAAGGVLKRGAAGRTYPLTLREMGRRGLAEFPAPALADFTLGRYLDQRPSMWQAMYHPYVLRDEVEKHFGVAPELLYERKRPPLPEDGPTGRPWALLIGLIIALPLIAARATGRFERAALAFTSIPLALMGVVLWTVAIISSIPTLRWNEALLLYVPFDAALPFLGEQRRRQYARVRLGFIVGVSLLRAVGLFRQPLWIPIVIAFVIFSAIAVDLRRGRAVRP
jgi:hypothetical protein